MFPAIRAPRQLLQARIGLQLSVREAARGSGVSAAQISKLENAIGNPTLSTIRKLTRFYKIDSRVWFL